MDTFLILPVTRSSLPFFMGNTCHFIAVNHFYGLIEGKPSVLHYRTFNCLLNTPGDPFKVTSCHRAPSLFAC